MRRIRIIRSAVGSSPSLGLIKELQRNSVDVIGIDSDPRSYGLELLERSYVVPRGSDPRFMDALYKIIKKERPHAILTGPEEELITLARNKRSIESKGVLVLCPGPGTVEICIDKLKTHRFLSRIGVPVPRLYTSKNVKFPAVIKPRCGRGSKDVYIVHDRKELGIFLGKVENPIIQEFIDGPEYSIDVLADRQGNPLSIVPRRRLATESGISTKGITEMDAEMVRYCRLITKKLRIFGPSCIQCFKNDAGLWFNEINLRFGGGAILSVKADPTMIPNLVRLIKGQRPVKSKGFVPGLVMLRNYSEIFVNEGRKRLEAVIFDLDETLYDVTQYFKGAFLEIARYLARKHHLDEKRLFEGLMDLWKERTSMYPHLFDLFLRKLRLTNELNRVVRMFNGHIPVLRPLPRVLPTLERLRKEGIRIGILSDGNARRQRNKLFALGISRFIDVALFPKEFGESKPSKEPYQRILTLLGTDPGRTYYVGDNPALDFKGAKAAGMRTVRLRRGEFKDRPRNAYIDIEIRDIKELPRAVL